MSVTLRPPCIGPVKRLASCRRMISSSVLERLTPHLSIASCTSCTQLLVYCSAARHFARNESWVVESSSALSFRRSIESSENTSSSSSGFRSRGLHQGSFLRAISLFKILADFLLWPKAMRAILVLSRLAPREPAGDILAQLDPARPLCASFVPGRLRASLLALCCFARVTTELLDSHSTTGFVMPSPTARVANICLAVVRATSLRGPGPWFVFGPPCAASVRAASLSLGENDTGVGGFSATLNLDKGFTESLVYTLKNWERAPKSDRLLMRANVAEGDSEGVATSVRPVREGPVVLSGPVAPNDRFGLCFKNQENAALNFSRRSSASPCTRKPSFSIVRRALKNARSFEGAVGAYLSSHWYSTAFSRG
eukprot:1191358-Prorocentrum_minimum.AAC.3